MRCPSPHAPKAPGNLASALNQLCDLRDNGIPFWSWQLYTMKGLNNQLFSRDRLTDRPSLWLLGRAGSGEDRKG